MGTVLEVRKLKCLHVFPLACLFICAFNDLYLLEIVTAEAVTLRMFSGCPHLPPTYTPGSGSAVRSLGPWTQSLGQAVLSPRGEWSIVWMEFPASACLHHCASFSWSFGMWSVGCLKACRLTSFS